jgi:hypothetical protein
MFIRYTSADLYSNSGKKVGEARRINSSNLPTSSWMAETDLGTLEGPSLEDIKSQYATLKREKP